MDGSSGKKPGCVQGHTEDSKDKARRGTAKVTPSSRQRHVPSTPGHWEAASLQRPTALLPGQAGTQVATLLPSLPLTLSPPPASEGPERPCEAANTCQVSCLAPARAREGQAGACTETLRGERAREATGGPRGQQVQPGQGQDTELHIVCPCTRRGHRTSVPENDNGNGTSEVMRRRAPDSPGPGRRCEGPPTLSPCDREHICALT